MKFKGLKLEDLLKIDTSTLNLAEVEELNARLVSTANRRVNALRKDRIGRLSPSVSGNKKGFGIDENKLPSSKSKRRNKILKNITKTKRFLNTPTSTVKGANKFFIDMSKKISKYSGIKKTLTPSQFKRFWKVWDKVREILGGSYTSGKVDSPVWKKIVELIKKGTYTKNEDIISAVTEVAREEYETTQEKLNELEESTDVFTDYTDYKS